MDGKLRSLGKDGKDLPIHIFCICGFTHDCECMVDGSNATVAP